AEAVLDIIRAKTDSALRMGIAQIKGALSAQVNSIRNALLGILSLIEANIDFPEEEISTLNLENIFGKLKKINNQLKGILEDSRHGRILREGINVVICGKPNVGKSSLLNALLRQERSIVTAIAGTTRDTIEETIDIKGVPMRIVDTAGILEPRDLIEKKAVERSKKYIDSADLVVLLFDSSRRLTREDRFLMQRLRKKAVIAVINKVDLKQKICRKEVLKRFKRAVEISAKKMKNINLLEEAIVDLAYNGRVTNPESIVMSNLRQIEAARRAQKLLDEAGDSLDNKLSLEFVAQDIKEALLFLDDILGRRFQEDLLDKIFKEFCIGK
ncbi:MAG: tRNA uridine-5-carboxymethylaminomethyl(34) synthesis GTPase MnmE, partial [Candidatus Omnitrophica bacterium]|nr:tRNA uridine-5-carboxymethylaminomethyl(34) synthesis GTPase MnmE [Candidatus Omnitrophota bacterium]